MDFEKKYKETKQLIENALAEYVKETDIPQKRIVDAMRYSLLAGGKRIRPIIMIYACEMCGGNVQDVLPFACAIEMIHTHSLIHDDLPALDNDDLRRGIPTNHKKFDEATAILAGDALLNLAFEITSECINPDLKAKDVLKAVSVLAKSTGVNGMLGGQMIDIESENKKLSLAELQNLHLHKTGAIIRSSGVCGAIIGGADEKQIQAIDEFCKNLGIAFQIQDDILDVIGNEKLLGKPIGSDAENNKNTYVVLTSLEKAKELAKEYTQKANDSLAIFGDDANNLLWLSDMLINRSY